MNLSGLLFAGKEITFRGGRAQLFRRTPSRAAPFLVLARPAGIAFPGRPSEAGAETKRARLPAGLVEKLEAMLLRWVTILLALTCIGCGVGVQHIFYVRQRNALGRQLRQKESEVRAVTQAYHSLEADVAANAAGEVRPVPGLTNQGRFAQQSRTQTIRSAWSAPSSSVSPGPGGAGFKERRNTTHSKRFMSPSPPSRSQPANSQQAVNASHYRSAEKKRLTA